MAQTTGNVVMHVVVRLLKTEDPASTATALLEPMYGESGSYKVIQLTESDPYEVDVDVTFNLAAVITHLESKIIRGERDLIIGGIVYPTFNPVDDLVSYDGVDIAYNTVSSLFEPRVNPNIEIET